MKKQILVRSSRRKRFLGMTMAFTMALSLMLEGMPMPGAQAAGDAGAASAAFAQEADEANAAFAQEETVGESDGLAMAEQGADVLEEEEPVWNGETSADVKKVLAGEVDLTSESYDKTETVTKYVYDFMDLYLALGLEGNFDIKVMKDIEERWTEKTEKQYIFEVNGEKKLDLNGHSILMHNDYCGEWYYERSHTLAYISKDASLTIYDSSNATDLDDVRFLYDGYATSGMGHGNKRDLFCVNGTLIVNGGKLQAGHKKRVWIAAGEDDLTGDYWGDGWGYALILGSVAWVGGHGTFIMNGGKVEGYVEKEPEITEDTPNYVIQAIISSTYSTSVIKVCSGGHALINGGIVEGFGEGTLLSFDHPEDGLNTIAAGAFSTGWAFTQMVWTNFNDRIREREATKLGFDESFLKQGATVWFGDWDEESPDIVIMPPNNKTCTLAAPNGELTESELTGTTCYQMDSENAIVKVTGVTPYFTDGVTGPGLDHEYKYTWTLWDAVNRTYIDQIETSLDQVNVAYDFPNYKPKEETICSVECKVEESLRGYVAVTKSDQLYLSTVAPSYDIEDLVYLNESNFPDDHFRRYLKWNYDANDDNVLSKSEIAAIETLNLINQQIASLDGLHYLWNVKRIWASENPNLRSFDGTNLPYLMELDLERCGIDSIDVSKNHNLRSLNLQGINDYNIYGTLNVLDVSGCPLLCALRLDGSLVNNLDISYNPYLLNAVLYGTKTQVGTNQQNDSYHSFELQEDGRYCRLDYRLGSKLYVAHLDEAVPDAALRGYFTSQVDSNKDGLLQDYEAMEVTMLFCEESDVKSLKGIELLPNLERLDAYDNEISSVDFSKNLKLKDISIYLNKLDDLDVSMLTELIDFSCSRNTGALRDVDFSQNLKLQSLSFANSGLKNVNVSGLQNLSYLNLENNMLADLNVRGCTGLKTIYVGNNHIVVLELGDNTALTRLEAHNNNLYDLKLDNNEALEILSCYGNPRLSVVDIEKCTKLAAVFLGNYFVEQTDSKTGLTYVAYRKANSAVNYLSVSAYQYVSGGSVLLFFNENIESKDVYDGNTAKFAVNAVGNEVKYQWYVKNPSDPNPRFEEAAGETTPEITILADLERCPEGLELYCQIKDKDGYSLESNHVTLNILPAPIKIVTQPVDYKGVVGSIARFSVGAQPADGVTVQYQWSYQVDEETAKVWKNFEVESATQATLEVEFTEELVGCAVRCYVWDGQLFSVTTKEAYFEEVIPETEVIITKQPKNWYGEKYGVKASFDVEATGLGLSYQWQYKKGSGDWTDWGITTADTANLKASLSEKTEKYQIRCKITDRYGVTAYSNEVRMMLAENNPIQITAQPKNYYNAVVGKKASFDVVATGSDNLHYQWQWDKGGTWQDYAGATADTPNFKVSVNDTTLKRKYRCEVTDDEGNWIYTVEVKISQDADPGNEEPYINIPIVITKQPVDWVGTYGKKASFSVEVNGGLGSWTYQWQYKKNGNWIDYAITTADTPNFKVTMNEKNVKWPIRCLITAADGRTQTTDEVWMKLKTDEPEPEPQPITGGPEITGQPTDWVGLYGKKAQFTVTATGNGLSYQWQYKKGTGAWTNYAIATADTANFSVTMNEKNVKWLYRCVITDADGKTATTNEVHMYLKGEEPAPVVEGPVITGQPGDFTGRIGKKATFSVTATGEGLTYEWQVKKTGGWSAYALAGYDTPTFQVSINDKTATWTYRCVIRDASGHEVATNEVRIIVAE